MFIGSSLNVIFGSKDANDFEDWKLVQRQLTDYNNKQKEIDTKIKIRIEMLTNKVVKFKKEINNFVRK